MIAHPASMTSGAVVSSSTYGPANVFRSCDGVEGAAAIDSYLQNELYHLFCG